MSSSVQISQLYLLSGKLVLWFAGGSCFNSHLPPIGILNAPLVQYLNTRGHFRDGFRDFQMPFFVEPSRRMGFTFRKSKFVRKQEGVM